MGLSDAFAFIKLLSLGAIDEGKTQRQKGFEQNERILDFNVKIFGVKNQRKYFSYAELKKSSRCFLSHVTST